MKQPYIKRFVIAIALLATFPLVSNAALIGINFDNNPDGFLDPPFVGTGTFGFDGTATDGIFDLSSLTNFSFDFDFSGDTFSNTDIATPISEVLVVISGSGTRVNFANTGPLSGPRGGSIDFTNLANSSETVLTFQPGDGNPPLPTLYATSSFFGEYSGSPSTAPVPSTAFLFLAAFGIVLLRKKVFQPGT